MLIVQCLQSKVTDEFAKCEDLKPGMLVQNLVCVVKRVDSIWIDKLKNTIKAVLEIFDETNLYRQIICNLWTPWHSINGELKAGNLIHLRHFHATSVNNELQLTGYCGLLNVAAFGYNNYGDDIEYIFWSNEPPKEQRVFTASLAKRVKHLRRLISAVFGEMMRVDADIDTPIQVSAETLTEIFGEATTSLNFDENYDFNIAPASKAVTTRNSKRKASPKSATTSTEPKVVDDNQGMKLLIDWRKEKSSSNVNFESTNLAAYKIDQALGGNRLKRPISYAPFELLKPRIKGDVKISKLSECTANGCHNLAVQLIGYELRANGSVLRVWDGTNPKFINLDLRDSFTPPDNTVHSTLSRKVGKRFMDIFIPKRYNEIVEMFKPGEFMVLIGVRIGSLYAPEWTLDGNEGKRVYLLNKEDKLGKKLSGQLDKVHLKESSKEPNSRSKSKSKS